MNKTLPNKWVRKAVYDAINDIIVDGVTIPCYTSRVDNDYHFYTILATQTNNQRTTNKCESHWVSSILIDIVTIYNGTNNPANRSFVDNITDAIIQATNNLTLDVISGLKIEVQNIVGLDNLDNQTDTQNVFRNLLRYELTIN